MTTEREAVSGHETLSRAFYIFSHLILSQIYRLNIKTDIERLYNLPKVTHEHKLTQDQAFFFF